MKALKYGRHRAAGDALGRVMAGAIPPAVLPADVVVPVPLHPQRLAERGFNQAELLARPVARALSVPCRSGCLRRILAQAPQASLPASARRHNLDDAFVATPAAAGNAILLIDDVMSTGATIEACAQALKHAGAARVAAFTLARAVLGGPGRAAAEGPAASTVRAQRETTLM